jgi:hypothetical protein
MLQERLPAKLPEMLPECCQNAHCCAAGMLPGCRRNTIRMLPRMLQACCQQAVWNSAGKAADMLPNMLPEMTTPA